MIKTYKQFKFCFFSRNGGISKGEFRSLNCSKTSKDLLMNVNHNLGLVKKKIRTSNIVLMNQIHSNKVINIKKIDKTYTVDGLISKKKNIVLGVLTADCAPIVILGEKYFGIVHAGWKGVFSNIIENAVKKLIQNGEIKKNLVFIVGPHLMTYSFEIKEDFIKLMEKSKLIPENFIEQKKEKKFFNFSKLIESKINQLGIKNYKISKEDTFSNPKKYFSYRYYLKKGIKYCGRQISLVGIKDR